MAERGNGPGLDILIDLDGLVAGLFEPGPPTPGLLEARISGLTEATYRSISGLTEATYRSISGLTEATYR